MILTDREINIALRQKHIEISPEPAPDAFSSTSVDLNLSDRFGTWRAAAGVQIRPGAPGYSYKNLLQFQDQHKQPTIEVRPRSFILAWTAERVELPENARLAGRVEGKSSLARLGIGVHVTAPTIHAGFRGTIQLEIFNFGPHAVVLDAGMPICQLILEQTFGTPEKGYQGMFLDQSA